MSCAISSSQKSCSLADYRNRKWTWSRGKRLSHTWRRSGRRSSSNRRLGWSEDSCRLTSWWRVSFSWSTPSSACPWTLSVNSLSTIYLDWLSSLPWRQKRSRWSLHQVCSRLYKKFLESSLKNLPNRRASNKTPTIRTAPNAPTSSPRRTTIQMRWARPRAAGLSSTRVKR